MFRLLAGDPNIAVLNVSTGFDPSTLLTFRLTLAEIKDPSVV